ncbi:MULTISPECIES: type II toxin-antitoxin system RelE/ParE family toxin [unclassified Pseudoalteromonas]|uniref:type II toxin-antitoxin system RelE/ParE family toxin n=1 Tax=unclassified Pseudoalteromonas TaxID=194690 RepID=UPI0006E68A29|nr:MULTISPECIES: type II toxin-antitoxin system RelE/ParE family toxin [unclassified Pseudoalteromonas]KPV98141.1 hypothetical protein AN213_03659 [Pseudoalteromonas sp. P1-8]KPZ67243.1 hypothetical protein AN394_03811 [Pseudoalteromonas sp. P1-26]
MVKTSWILYKTLCKRVVKNPEIGRSCNDIYPNGFYFPIGKHTAYFIKEDGFIMIVAVLNQSQLPENHL